MDTKFKASLDWKIDSRQMGMVTLEKDWFGIKRIPFRENVYEQASKLKKGDKVIVEIKGGRKNPVIHCLANQ